MVKRVRKTGRKIDVSAELQAVEEAADARQMMEKSADELFMVDTQGSFKGNTTAWLCWLVNVICRCA